MSSPSEMPDLPPGQAGDPKVRAAFRHFFHCMAEFMSSMSETMEYCGEVLASDDEDESDGEPEVEDDDQDVIEVTSPANTKRQYEADASAPATPGGSEIGKRKREEGDDGETRSKAAKEARRDDLKNDGTATGGDKNELSPNLDAEATGTGGDTAKDKTHALHGSKADDKTTKPDGDAKAATPELGYMSEDEATKDFRKDKENDEHPLPAGVKDRDGGIMAIDGGFDHIDDEHDEADSAGNVIERKAEKKLMHSIEAIVRTVREIDNGMLDALSKDGDTDSVTDERFDVLSDMVIGLMDLPVEAERAHQAAVELAMARGDSDCGYDHKDWKWKWKWQRKP